MTSNLQMNLDQFNFIADEKRVFEKEINQNQETASNVANFWYSFSFLMPSLLVQAANNLERSNERETLLTIAREERGEVDGIPHFKMFSEACALVGLSPRLLDLTVLDDLMLYTLKSDNHKTLGLCFGLEVIANENIEYLFQSLISTPKDAKLLANTDFFRIHRLNEDTHIEMNFNNFKKYCLTAEDKESFMAGFNYALTFWKIFWFLATDDSRDEYELIS